MIKQSFYRCFRLNNIYLQHKKINFCLLLIFCALIISISFLRPWFNWDIVAYTAAVENMEETSIYQAHKKTWALVETVAGRKHFERLSSGSKYSIAMYRDANNLHSMLPMYSVKIGYVTTLKTVSFFVNPIHAAMIISSLSACVITVLIFFLSIKLPSVLSYIWLPMVMLLEITHLARFLTPDALVTGIYLASFWLLFHRHYALALLPLLIAVTVRPDSIVLNVVLGVTFYVYSRYFSIVLITASCGIYFMATRISGHLGWWPHFYFSFVERRENLYDIGVSFDIIIYLEHVIKAFISAGSEMWPFAMVLLAIIIFGLGYVFEVERRFLILAGASVVSSIMKFLIFPLESSRLFSPQLYGMAATLLFVTAIVITRVQVTRAFSDHSDS